MKFVMIHAGRYTSSPFTIQRITTDNWVLLVDEGDSGLTWCNSFVSLAAAKDAASHITPI